MPIPSGATNIVLSTLIDSDVKSSVYVKLNVNCLLSIGV